MAALILQLLLLVGASTSLRFVEADRVHVLFQGSILTTGGYLTCEGGRSAITLATRAPGIEETLAHELAHAADCLDDGALNGSPLRSGATLARPSAHCLADLVEFYACWAVEQGSTPEAAVLAEPASTFASH